MNSKLTELRNLIRKEIKLAINELDSPEVSAARSALDKIDKDNKDSQIKSADATIKLGQALKKDAQKRNQ